MVKVGIPIDFRNDLLRIEKKRHDVRSASAAVNLMEKRSLADPSRSKQQDHLVAGVIELMSDPVQVVLTPEKHFGFANRVADDIRIRNLRKRNLRAKRYQHLVECLRQIAQLIVGSRPRQL